MQEHIKNCDGWWCRGCGGCSKKEKMEEMGYNNIELIYDLQFGCCGKPHVPCFVCNRDGKKKNPSSEISSNPTFWYGFKLPSEATCPLPVPKHFCKGCDKGWWCGGCGDTAKRDALNHHGFSKEQIKFLCEKHRGKCTDPLVPCFICNRDGDIQCEVPFKAVESMFWEDVIIPGEMPVEEEGEDSAVAKLARDPDIVMDDADDDDEEFDEDEEEDDVEDEEEEEEEEDEEEEDEEQDGKKEDGEGEAEGQAMNEGNEAK